METSPRQSAQIGAFAAKNSLGTLLDRVEQGEEIIITRMARPVARLVPNLARQDQVSAAFQRIRERAKKLARENPGTPSFDWNEVKKLRDAGRP